MFITMVLAKQYVVGGLYVLAYVLRNQRSCRQSNYLLLITDFHRHHSILLQPHCSCLKMLSPSSDPGFNLETERRQNFDNFWLLFLFSHRQNVFQRHHCQHYPHHHTVNHLHVLPPVPLLPTLLDSSQTRLMKTNSFACREANILFEGATPFHKKTWI